jgi:L-seryl-tRNA(Ser) seleniumtransferase
LLTQVVRQVLDHLRIFISQGCIDAVPDVSELAHDAAILFEQFLIPNFRRVINCTGVILHTNLGRAPLSVEALEAVAETGRGYANLEYDISSGERGSRHEHTEELLKILTGAEASMAVNNNAAAILLALASINSSHGVAVSRGELVEIGGSFRIPDILAQSGHKLIEVGTTNKTHLRDYKQALADGAGTILRVNPSNFKMTGFVSRPSLGELSELALKHGVPLIEDAGSGCMLDLAPYGITDQPTVSGSVRSGADIITFSGDKLLGGPQAGLIVGRSVYINKMKAHPLARALRIDKLCLAALEATLRLYLNPQTAVKKIPVLQMLCAPVYELNEKAERLRSFLDAIEPKTVSVVTESGQTGGGAMPGSYLESAAVAIDVPHMPAHVLEEGFRTLSGSPPVIGRISRGRFLLDVRTVHEDDFGIIACKFAEILR